MAVTVICDTTEIVSLEEYLDYVRRNLDPTDTDTLLASAPMLRKLANDRELVVKKLNEQIKRSLSGRVLTTTQVVFLGEGKDFYLRANIWPSTADVANGRVYQDQFSYDLCHDHNYNFLTTNHWGPGYVTEIYEYDREKLAGYIGEHVDCRFLERVHFNGNKVMMYRAGKDIHTQYPPEDLSISINLMTSTAEVRTRDQYFFDLGTSTLKDFPPDLDGSRRGGIIEMAAHAGDDETRDLLTTIGLRHEDHRTRLVAWEALSRLKPDDAAQVWEKAVQDPAQMVSKAAREKLQVLSSH